jgi:GT2 family glycosyltransferase
MPRWSVIVPTYRPDETLRQALLSIRAAAAVSGESMQLEVVDDASPDRDVAALLASWSLGDIPVYRRPQNGGLATCWNHCIQRARGELVHILHQDDLVEPHFYERMSAMARRCPEAGMIVCGIRYDEAGAVRLAPLEQEEGGVLPDWLATIASGQRLQCPCVVVRRDVYEQVGGFDPGLRFVLDWEMWVRIAAAFPVAYVPEPLATYRIHDKAETRRLKQAGVITRDLALGVERIAVTLKRAGRLDCLASTRLYAWRTAGMTAYEAEVAHRPGIALRELAESVKCFGIRIGAAELLKRARWALRLAASTVTFH